MNSEDYILYGLTVISILTVTYFLVKEPNSNVIEENLFSEKSHFRKIWKYTAMFEPNWHAMEYNDSNWDKIELPALVEANELYLRGIVQLDKYPYKENIRLITDGCIDKLYIDGMDVPRNWDCKDMDIKGLQVGTTLVAFKLSENATYLDMDIIKEME